MNNQKWSVIKRDGEWRILHPNGFWHDSAPTLVEAHTYATQLSVADVLFEGGGLTILETMKGAMK